MARPGLICNLNSTLVLALLIVATPIPVAATESEALAELYGVWIGRGVIENNVVSPNREVGFAADVAIWKSTTGFKLTWKNLSQSVATRTTIHFAKADESNRIGAEWTKLPMSTEERLWGQFKDHSLIVYRTLGETDNGRVARYRFSVQAGYMTFDYDLSQTNELLEAASLTLRRVKIIM